MRIKNYSSSVEPQRSLGKIQELLAAHGARRIQIRYTDERKPECVERGRRWRQQNFV